MVSFVRSWTPVCCSSDLTLCDLVTAYGCVDLCRHRARQYQTIAWFNSDKISTTGTYVDAFSIVKAVQGHESKCLKILFLNSKLKQQKPLILLCIPGQMSDTSSTKTTVTNANMSMVFLDKGPSYVMHATTSISTMIVAIHQGPRLLRNFHVKTNVS